MRLRIVSNGSGYGTTVCDADTGDPVLDVESVTWHCAGGYALARATIVVARVPVDVTGEVVDGPVAGGGDPRGIGDGDPDAASAGAGVGRV